MRSFFLQFRFRGKAVYNFGFSPPNRLHCLGVVWGELQKLMGFPILWTPFFLCLLPLVKCKSELLIFRSYSSDLPVPAPELPELVDDDEEDLLGGDVEEQGHEVPVLQYY